MFGFSAFSGAPFSSLGGSPLILTGQQLNLSVGNVLYNPETGWGRDAWGTGPWGVEGVIVGVTGQQLNTLLNSVTPLANADVTVVGEALVKFIENNVGVSAGGSVQLPAIEEIQLELSLNSVNIGIGIDVLTTGQQLNISQGDENIDLSVIVEVSSIAQVGWGVVAWGNQKWGESQVDLAMVIAEGIADPNPDVILQGQQINISLNSVTSLADANVNLTGQQVNLLLNSVTPLANANVDLTGQQVNITEGEVDPSPDATVTGIGITVSLAVGTVVIGTGNVTLTGEQINIAQGTAIGDANTIVNASGRQLNTRLGTVFAGTTVVVPITGNLLTISLNSINNQIWTEINTGTDANWSNVSTGTTATWTEIDTAA
jgi:hypothetical protein